MEISQKLTETRNQNSTSYNNQKNLDLLNTNNFIFNKEPNFYPKQLNDTDSFSNDAESYSLN